MSFPRYPKYKDSGVEWLGEVPEHWDVMRLGRLFRQVNEPGDDELQILSVSIHDGVSDSELNEEEMDRKVTRSDDRTKYKKVAPGDLVYNMMRAWQGGFGTVSVQGMVSPAYVVARPVAEFSTVFIEQLLRTPQAIEQMRRHSQGVTDFRLRLYWEEFKSIVVVVPPTLEQEAIDAFIGHETAKIDELVAEQRRLIELLKEKRQAVISHAVTKGLNPNVPLRPSGIEWLGDIPEHWELKPLKYLIELSSGGTPSKENTDYWNGDVPWASSKDLKTPELFDTQDHITQKALDDHAAELIPAGSILTVVRGMILLHTFPVVVAKVPMAINQDLKAVVPRGSMTSDYLAWLLRGASSEVLARTDEAAHGTKVLRMDAWLAMPVPIPPDIEQHEIVNGIIKRLNQLDVLINEAERAIELLQERRTALISAAVTGKIDVRGFAQKEGS